MAITLNLMVWAVAVSNSGFWADDFLWVTHFSRSLGDLSNYHFNVGKYIINAFWALGTEAFGDGSVVPFLMLNSVVFATGVIMWLWAGTKERWSSVEAWWIGGLFIATAAWLPTTLWSSNITHSGGFLALGVGVVAHGHVMRARNARDAQSWSALSGAAWTFAVASNLLYIGLIVIAAYCTWHQIARFRHFGVKTPVAALTVGSWSLLLPIAYFVAIGYPGTTSSSPYAMTGLQFLHENIRFYKLLLAPTDLLTAVYVVLLLGGVIGAFAALRRKDYFPIAVLGAAGATALPALVQSQQRFVNYMAMPLLLLLSAFVAGAQPVLRGKSKRAKNVILVTAVVALLLLFHQGGEIRAYFTSSPYGSNLATFRSQVASFTPEGATICAELDLDASQEALFIAEISGENGFRVPPIDAARAYLVRNAKECPANGPAAHITVRASARDDFVVSE
ncbi:MAG TPA: hypothetical protein VN845_12575 [Solirubrobacteraceae bacterium]|nr:hypothetical protein [Solirubrobacteraceae bacterium]